MNNIDKTIKESVDKVIIEKLNDYREPVLEMARINTNENGNCIFP